MPSSVTMDPESWLLSSLILVTVTWSDRVSAHSSPYQLFVLEAWGQSDLLEQVLLHRGLGAERSRGIVQQVLAALSWLHSRTLEQPRSAMKVG